MFSRYENLISMYRRMFPELDIDVKADLARYKQLAERVRPFVKDTVLYINSALKQGKKVLVEGANAVFLDIDFGKEYYNYFHKTILKTSF